jgi:hypothetical protein
VRFFRWLLQRTQCFTSWDATLRGHRGFLPETSVQSVDGVLQPSMRIFPRLSNLKSKQYQNHILICTVGDIRAIISFIFAEGRPGVGGGQTSSPTTSPNCFYDAFSWSFSRRRGCHAACSEFFASLLDLRRFCQLDISSSFVYFGSSPLTDDSPNGSMVNRV